MRAVSASSLGWLMAIAAVFTVRLAVGEDTAAARRTLTSIEAGTLVGAEDAERWNRVVLLAKPRIASGDVDTLPKAVREAVGSFVLTILATVEEEPSINSDSSARYRLSEVGLGYSVMHDEGMRVVTVADADRLGVRLGFFQRQMLGENQKQLATVRVIARTSTLVVFDTPSVMLRDGRHRDFVTRHFVWLDPRSGRTAMLVWLLDSDQTEGLRVANEAMRFVPSGYQEDRAIHVDGNEFSILGIPSDHAFALEDLPSSTAIEWTAEARQLAARRQYDAASLRGLTEALNAALQNRASAAQSSQAK